MTKVSLTTGQVSGLTSLPYPTIRRYIVLFSDLFSEGAKIQSRGRRFNESDCDLLMKVRGLYARGFATPAVRQALTEGWTPDHPTRRDVLDSVRVAEYTQKLLSQIQDKASKMTLDNQVLQRDMKDCKSSLDFLTQRVDEHESALAKYQKQIWSDNAPDYGELVITAGIVLAIGVLAVGRGTQGWIAGVIAVVALAIGFFMSG
jgi:DNA-binding transcriptional MerR regulator